MAVRQSFFDTPKVTKIVLPNRTTKGSTKYKGA